ncbi:FKBP-type peptidyl-prolyl cis-trans isomerase [Kitasatospora sp. NPDC047058]|uniref:protein kinase domain-containing protein n=1 Tax=Kitasatospora sp. NPDC047058 TaxID=3155620 RepID=UPI0033C6032E
MRPLESDDPVRIGAYRLVGRLGSGGMGEVFLGRSGDGGLAAIKTARAEYAQDPEFRQRFAREVEAARRVDGRFTAAVLDADPSAGRPWLATEYIAGVSVTEAVAGRGPLPEASVRALVAGMAAALEEIHRAGITHRDLKPSNVLLADDGPRVIDFGIARTVDHTRITRTGQAFGTPGYMAPEQLRGGQAGPAADVYALAATAVFAASGEGPHGSGELLALIYRTVEEEPQLGSVPAGLRGTLARCLAKDPALRPNVAELRAEFAVGSTLGGGEWLPAELSTLVLGRGEEARATQPYEPPSSGARLVAGPGAPSTAEGGVAPGAGPSRRGLLFAGVGGGVAAVAGTLVAAALVLDERAAARESAAATASAKAGSSAGASASPAASPSATASSPAAASPSASAPATVPADSQGLPAITAGTAFGERPVVAAATGPLPTELISRTLVQGTGPVAGPKDLVTCHYVLQKWGGSRPVDSSYARQEPLSFQLGAGQTIKGWDAAIRGKAAGSRIEFAVPPALGYGSEGAASAGITGTDVLVYVADILTVTKAGQG